MGKKLIDLKKLERVMDDPDNPKQCYSCILDNICYGSKYHLLNDRDRDIIANIFDNCPNDGKSYQLKDEMQVDDDEIV